MKKVKWVLDPAHSELSFKIRHLMISNVSGYIKDFHVEAETPGNDFSEASIMLTAQMANLYTNDEKRDNHLRSADFFDANNFPDLKFESIKIEKVDNKTFMLYGKLTMKGITKPVTLNVEFGGIAQDAHGNDRAGFSITGKITRSDWGISFNRVLDTGGVGLGEEVKILSEIQMVKQTLADAV